MNEYLHNGYGLFESDSGALQIQKIDEQEKYATDQEALVAFGKDCADRDPKALKILDALLGLDR